MKRTKCSRRFLEIILVVILAVTMIGCKSTYDCSDVDKEAMWVELDACMTRGGFSSGANVCLQEVKERLCKELI